MKKRLLYVTDFFNTASFCLFFSGLLVAFAMQWIELYPYLTAMSGVLDSIGGIMRFSPLFTLFFFCLFLWQVFRRGKYGCKTRRGQIWYIATTAFSLLNLLMWGAYWML